MGTLARNGLVIFQTYCEICDTHFDTLNTIFFVLESCFNSPFTRLLIPRLLTSIDMTNISNIEFSFNFEQN